MDLFKYKLSFLLIVLCLCCCSKSSTSGSNTDNGTTHVTTHSQLPSCDTVSEPFFTHSPIDISLLGTDFTNIMPLGGANPPGGHVFSPDHFYFCFKDDETAMNVYAPGSAAITEIKRTYYDYDSDGVLDDGEAGYTLQFSPCNQFKGEFLHVTTLEDFILSELGEYGASDCSGNVCYKEVLIPIAAGQLIGTAGNSPDNTCLDFGAHDSRLDDLGFVSPERYNDASYRLGYVQTRCPLDYYNTAIEPYLSLVDYIGNYDTNTGTFSQRTDDPICGTFMQDLSGTAKGNWWPDTTSLQADVESSCITLVNDNITPSTTQRLSIGTTAMSGVDSADYNFTIRTSGRINRDFADVTEDGNIYCYEDFSLYGADLIFLVQISNGNLLIEKKDFADCDSYAADASQWLFSNSTTFYR